MPSGIEEKEISGWFNNDAKEFMPALVCVDDG